MDETTVKTFTQEEVNRLLQDEKDRVDKTVRSLQEENQRMIDETIAEIRAKNTPPSKEEIQTLLEQEYAEFVVKVRTADKERKERVFTITELPQALETKFITKLQDKVLPRMKGLLGELKSLLESDIDKQAELLVKFLEPFADAMAEAVSIILNPYDEEKDVTPEWVSANISSSRQWNIIVAQERANKMRDFFSQVSLASIGETMRGVRFQK